MPNFARNASDECVYKEAQRDVFRRGRRLDLPTCRRMRDIIIHILHDIGADSEDIATIVSQKITGRQCRNRLADVRIDTELRLELAKTLLRAQREVAAEPPTPAVPPATPKPRRSGGRRHYARQGGGSGI